jgi:hypothetical protein
MGSVYCRPMPQDRKSRVTRILGAIVGGGFLILGVAELVTRLDDPLPLLFWLPALWVGGALVLIGVFRTTVHPTLSIALVVVGTAAGLLASFWTILMPVLGLTLVVVTILNTGRQGDRGAVAGG